MLARSRLNWMPRVSGRYTRNIYGVSGRCRIPISLLRRPTFALTIFVILLLLYTNLGFLLVWRHTVPHRDAHFYVAMRDAHTDYAADYEDTATLWEAPVKANVSSLGLLWQSLASNLEGWNKPWRGEERVSASENPNATEDINSHLESFERWCERYDNVDSVSRRLKDVPGDPAPRLCPCVPGCLRGYEKPMADLHATFAWEQIAKLLHHVTGGGKWVPPHCVARRRVAVIIPYRDRNEHLKVFMAHMHPLLQRQLLSYQVFVVEQGDPAVFNKAAMMNIGFLEASKLFDFDCVLFHDVDLLLEDDRAIFYCADNVTVHHVASLDRWKYKTLYKKVFGGAVLLTPTDFMGLNGYSNNYFGWGGEDDNFASRVEKKNLQILRHPNLISRYSAIEHPRDTTNEVNPFRRTIDQDKSAASKPEGFDLEGLNTVQYTIRQVLPLALYTWIHVDLNTEHLPYPTFYTRYNYKSVSGSCHEYPSAPKPLKDDRDSHDGRDNSSQAGDDDKFQYKTNRLKLSLASCKYRCDIRRKCKGLVYFHNKEYKCHLLRNVCTQPTPTEGATTYEKIDYVMDATMATSSGKFERSQEDTKEVLRDFDIVPGECYKGTNLDASSSLSLKDCAKACQATSACVAFVSYDVRPWRYCQLKEVLCKSRGFSMRRNSVHYNTFVKKWGRDEETAINYIHLFRKYKRDSRFLDPAVRRG